MSPAACAAPANLADPNAIIQSMQPTPAKPDQEAQNKTDAQAHDFIARWQGVALTEATELSSSQTFILELCALLDVDTPLPTDAADYFCPW